MSAEIFRFATIRQPQQVQPKKIDKAIVKAYGVKGTETAFHLKIREFHNAGESRDVFENHSQEFISSPNFVSNFDEIEIPLAHLDKWLRQHPTKVVIEDLLAVIPEIFSLNVTELISSDVYKTTRAQISDSLLALSMFPTDKNHLGPQLLRFMRICGLLEKLASSLNTLQSSGSVERVLNAIVVLPSDVFPLPSTASVRRRSILEAHKEELLRYEEVKVKTIELGKRLSDNMASIKELLEGFESDANDEREELFKIDQTAPDPQPSEFQKNTPKEDLEARFIPNIGGLLRPTILSKKRTQQLKQETKDVLEKIGVPTGHVDVPFAVYSIEKEIESIATELYLGGTTTTLTLVGSEFVATPTSDQIAPTDDSFAKTPGACLPLPPESPLLDSPTVPKEMGFVRPIGIADLMIVQQEIQRYTLGEVAHIENVLQGESKKRTHRKLEKTEESVLIETEELRETSNDLETAERFELQQESTNIINEDTSKEAGVVVTASYGPWVEVEAAANYANDSSTEKSKRSAQTYSQDVTNRTVNRIQKRSLEQRAITRITEFEEINEHGLENSEGTGHITGVYRWIDKVYKAQVVNYGLRTLLEFVIPEPAIFYRYVLTRQPTEGLSVEKSDPPGYCVGNTSKFVPLSPNDINVANYLYWVGKYEVTTEPPPPIYKSIGIALAMEVKEVSAPWGSVGIANEELQVPDGYLAKRAWLNGHKSEVHKSSIQVMIGRRKQSLTDDLVGHTLMNNEDDIIPVAMFGWGVLSFAVTITVLCERSPELYQQWQMDTYNAIMSAYRDQKARYEAELARIDIQDGIEISGRNPAQNREIESIELKRAALSQLTGQHFDDFDAMRRQVPPHGYPQMDLSEIEAEGKYIQFFEQAFEWKHMTYLFYPYFWGRKEDWPSSVKLDDNDPLFAKFLRAGAARVQVPIRPNYEGAVLHFLETKGSLWEGGDPPHVDDPLYVSILTEIQEEQNSDFTLGTGTISVTQNNATVTGTDTDFDLERDTDREIIIAGVRYRISRVDSATSIELSTQYEGVTATNLTYSFGVRFVGEPWEVKVPTSLVYLQQDSSLPDFT